MPADDESILADADYARAKPVDVFKLAAAAG